MLLLDPPQKSIEKRKARKTEDQHQPYMRNPCSTTSSSTYDNDDNINNNDHNINQQFQHQQWP
jgi:hypothetical protein